MITNCRWVLAIAVVVGVGALFSPPARAQEPWEERIEAPRVVIEEHMIDGQVVRIEREVGEKSPEQRLQSAIEAFLQAKESENTEAQAEARKQLATTIENYFDADLQRRQQELEQVEMRVRKLRAQLEQRRAKKQELVDLQMQVILNEADGMRFFGNSGSRGNSPFDAAGMGMQGQTGARVGAPGFGRVSDGAQRTYSVPAATPSRSSATPESLDEDF
jgi:hypothetical protein